VTTRSIRLASLAATLPVLAATIVAIAAWDLADGQAASRPIQSADAYTRSINDWRARREAALRADDGWLTLVGLHWLREGPNTVGGRPTADVPLPEGSAPADVGTIELTGGVATFRPAPSGGTRINGAQARPQPLRPQPGDYDVVTTGSVTFFVIKRGERYGVRVRDAGSPARRNFAGLHWYPVREHSRVTAEFVPHQSPTSIMIANVLGAVEPWPTPGKVVFTLDGREFTLHPVLDGADARELFFIFRDGTSGSDTYGGGRFLYAEMPKNGQVVLDFNKAESPPCAHTPFATCPLPPKENALPIRIEAGEMNPHR
jgi:uncharacterized protein (DUF1684 family)